MTVRLSEEAQLAFEKELEESRESFVREMEADGMENAEIIFKDYVDELIENNQEEFELTAA